MLLSRPLSVPFCLWNNPVLVARLPLGLITEVKLRSLVSGTWWAPFCVAGDGDGPLGEGYCEFCVATQYRGELESLEYLEFDLPDAEEFRLALSQVGIAIDKMDPDSDGCSYFLTQLTPSMMPPPALTHCPFLLQFSELLSERAVLLTL
jgi:hypothetical protein